MKKKEVIELQFGGILPTINHGEYALKMVSVGKEDEFFIVFIYNNTIAKSEAKYKKDRKLFDYLADNFAPEIVTGVIKIKNRRKVKKVAWFGNQAAFKFS